MAMAGVDNGPVLEGRDEWTMVHRVNDLIENGDMSDISLPPLPAFGTSENGSVDGSAAEDARDSKRTSGESNDEWSGTADPNSSSDWGSTGRRRGGVLTAADGGRNGSSSSRKRATGASRRRTSARSRSSRAGGVDSESSSSLSPAARPRRRAGRTERTGRRADEQAPSMVSSSGRSLASSPSCSPEASPSRSSASRGSGRADDEVSDTGGQAVEGGRSGMLARDMSWANSNTRSGLLFDQSDSCASRQEGLEDGGSVRRSRGDNGLEPFFLEDVTTIGPSETVSVTSSPFRNAARDDAVEDRWPPGMNSRLVPVRTLSADSTASQRLRAEDSVVVIGDADAPVDDGASSQRVPLQGALQTDDTQTGSPEGKVPEIAEGIGANDPPSFSTSKNHDSLRGREPGSKVPNAMDISAGAGSCPIGDSGLNSSGSYHMAVGQVSHGASLAPSTSCSGEGITPLTDAAPWGTASVGSAGRIPARTNVDSVAIVSKTSPGEFGALSVSSFSRGSFSSHAGMLLGGGTRDARNWGIASTGLGRGTESVVGYSGLNLAVMEARADAAEEQGEFWQGRARTAEEECRRLEKVVSEKASRIAELETLLREPSRVCSTSASDSCSSRCCGSDGGEESICQDSKENSNQRSSMSPGCAALSSPRRGDVKACGSGGVAHYIGERSMVPQSGLPRQSEDSVGDVAVDAGTARAVPAGDANRSVVLESEGAGIDGYEEDNPEDLVTRALARIGGIAFTGFSVGKVAMFFPTPEGNFLAFNVGCPGHFLSKESQTLVGRDEHFRPYYILGRIIEIQDVICCESNPFGLPCGHEIKVVYVETISSDLQAAGLQPCHVEV